jgi:hypothetical protein
MPACQENVADNQHDFGCAVDGMGPPFSAGTDHSRISAVPASGFPVFEFDTGGAAHYQKL